MKTSMPIRPVLYPKDVANIIGKGDKTARRLLQKIRKQVGKTNKEYVTVHDFCSVTGIPEANVWPFLVH